VEKVKEMYMDTTTRTNEDYKKADRTPIYIPMDNLPVALAILNQIADEIKKSWVNWDLRLRNGQQPVPIQDLDYWQDQIKRAVRILENW
jgi:hypothetical protein